MSQLIIEQIENEIIAKIKSNENLSVLKKVETYDGELDELLKAVRLFPSVFIHWGGFKNASGANNAFDRHHIFGVLIAARSLRGIAVRGSEYKIGAYRICHEVENVLHNKKLESGILSKLKITGSEIITLTKGCAIYKQEYEITEYYEA